MLQRTGVRCIWLTKNKGERNKMTPDDIATSLSGLKPVGDCNISQSRLTGTQSFVGKTWTIDDWV